MLEHYSHIRLNAKKATLEPLEPGRQLFTAKRSHPKGPVQRLDLSFPGRGQ
jgi:hypothetical protein